MILFPNAKINLGLRILGKRSDGYHDISTVMMPVGWEDVLEIVPSRATETRLHVTGNAVDCPPEKNLVMKAYLAMCDVTGALPPVDIYLRKIIPDGAGLGGGSSDAAFTLRSLNDLFNIGFDDSRLAEIAASLGADCPFFIYNEPRLCTGTGTEFKAKVKLNLSGYTLLIVKGKSVSIPTAKAYANATISGYDVESPDKVLSQPVAEWRDRLHNDFEKSIFAEEPQIAALKQAMYDGGAEYASMTGSGAAIYGLFKSDILAQRAAARFTDCVCKMCQL